MTQLTLTRMLRRSLLHRRARSLSALVALTVSAAVATALLTLYADLDNKLHKEFRTFGANIIITLPTSNSTNISVLNAVPDSSVAEASLTTNPSLAEGHAFRRAINQPAEGATTLPKASLSTPLPPSPNPDPQSEPFKTLLTQVQQAAGPEAIAAPFAYAVATTGAGTAVVVAGTDFAALRRLNAYWQVTSWPAKPTEALIGQRAAQFIGSEKILKLTFNNQPITLESSGHLITGGDEDSRIYIPLEVFTNWTHTRPTVIELQVLGGATKVEAALTRLQTIPGISAQPVRQLVEGEARIVDRTHALMYAAVLLIALTVGVSVLATLSASVLERRRDFALMKALGGSHLHLLALFLLEALALALAGVLAGWVTGSAAAFAISELNFHTPTLPHLSILPIVMLLNLLIATLAAVFPAGVLRRLEPAALLKGE